MAELPSGTITFLMTDIVGSSRLWERLPEAMRNTVARHEALLTEQIERHGGVVVRTKGEGDSIFAVFERAGDAVGAACDGQRALSAEPWSIDTPLRVRMALHSGEADLRDDNYYGPPVNRCARLRAVAHGGQILVSQATSDLIRDALATPIGLIDLGEYRLRDLLLPEQIFQVVHPDLPSSFPPLRSLEAQPTTLPFQGTTLVGRQQAVAEIRHLLQRGDVQVLTLTGPGGIGKTRLAVEVARSQIEERNVGVAFAELASIVDPAMVPNAIAGAVGVRERVDRPLIETLGESLRSVPLMLVLDNCEHVLEDCADAAQALRQACPELRILATSRAPLHVSGEVTWPVPLLPVGTADPTETDVAAHGEAVELFVERARLVVPDFALTAANAGVVAEICRRLEGLPLAIELAAARIRLLPPAAMLARLDRRLPFLVGGPRDSPSRQQTLRATIAWSHDLLSVAEQAVFRQLGIFASGFSLEAAEAVCASDVDSGISAVVLLDILDSLLSKNLLRQEPADREPRFTMLDTIREFARERLESSGDLAAVRDRCADYYLTLAEVGANQLLGPNQLVWLSRLDTELDQLRAIFGWSRDGEIASDLGLRLAGTLVMYWEFRGLAREGFDWVTTMLGVPSASARTVARARALYAAAFLVAMRGDYISQRSLAQESAAIFDEAGVHVETGRSLAEQAVAEARLGDAAVARTLLERSVEIAREHGDQWGLAFALGQIGAAAYQENDFVAARLFREEAASVARALGDLHTLGIALAGLALVARAQGNLGESAMVFHETLLVSRELEDQWIIPRAIGGLAGAAVLAADYQRAARLFGALAAMRELSGITEAAGSFRAINEADEAVARAALDDDTFEAAWSEGRAMTLQQSVAYALEASPPS
jgi:predicted ATPase/class 3 adenylate cyclase